MSHLYLKPQCSLKTHSYLQENFCGGSDKWLSERPVKDASRIITQQKTVRPHNITLTNSAAVEIFSLVGVNMSGLIKNQH